MTAKEFAQKIINKEIDPSGIDDIVRSSDTYNRLKKQLSTKPPLSGPVNQIKHAEGIRELYINKAAFDLTVKLITIWEESIKNGNFDLSNKIDKNFNNILKDEIKKSKNGLANYFIEKKQILLR